MNFQKIMNNCLKEMVLSYSKSERDTFDFQYFRDLFPNESDNTIAKCLYLLRDDNFVTIAPGSDLPYLIFLSANAIHTCQEDTLLKKGYTVIKEIKSLIG